MPDASDSTAAPLIVVDVGNSRIKFGLFDSIAEDTLPQPSTCHSVHTESWDPVEIALWLAPLKPAEVRWRIATVNRPAATRLLTWLEGEAATKIHQLTHEQLHLVVELERPHDVGMDRLLAAIAANRLRPQDRPAVVVDLGTAITVDVISAYGAFRGGAILPGIELSAKALHEFTDLLPQLSLAHLDEPPAALGTSTTEALTSGIYWGAVGAMRTLIEQLSEGLAEEPFVVLTGGAAPSVAKLLGPAVHFEPDLVLAGIALANPED